MAQALVTKAIQENAVMVFSKSYCPHCLRAKRVLDAELGQNKYAVMELESRSDCSSIQDYLSRLTGARTVPRVFIQGSFGTTTTVAGSGTVLTQVLTQLHILQDSALEVAQKQHSYRSLASCSKC